VIERQLVDLGMKSALINIPLNGTLMSLQRQAAQPPWTVWWHCDTSPPTVLV